MLPSSAICCSSSTSAYPQASPLHLTPLKTYPLLIPPFSPFPPVQILPLSVLRLSRVKVFDFSAPFAPLCGQSSRILHLPSLGLYHCCPPSAFQFFIPNLPSAYLPSIVCSLSSVVPPPRPACSFFLTALRQPALSSSHNQIILPVNPPLVTAFSAVCPTGSETHRATIWAGRTGESLPCFE